MVISASELSNTDMITYNNTVEIFISDLVIGLSLAGHKTSNTSQYTIDSWYMVVQYNTLLHIAKNFEGKTLVTLWTHKRHPYVALTGELWVSFMSYLEKSDHEILRVHCTQLLLIRNNGGLLWAAYLWKHDDVIKWKHFLCYWPFVRGIHRSRWIPRTKASDVELWCFLWSGPEWMVE